MNHAEVLLPTLVAVIVGTALAAAATYVRRLVVAARAREIELDALTGLARLAAVAPDLEVGIAAARPFVLHLAAATSMHLRWSCDDAPEWAPIPDRVVLPLGTSGRGPVSLVLDGVGRPVSVETLGHVLRLLCERDRCAVEAERVRRAELLTGVTDRGSLDGVLRRSELDGERSVVLISLDEVPDVEAEGRLFARLVEVISEQVRLTDAIVRSGDAELCVVLATESVRATQVVDRIRTAWRAEAPHATFSAGVAGDEGDQDDPGADPLERARTALERAQIEGGDRSVLVCPGRVQTAA